MATDRFLAAAAGLETFWPRVSCVLFIPSAINPLDPRPRPPNPPSLLDICFSSYSLLLPLYTIHIHHGRSCRCMFLLSLAFDPLRSDVIRRSLVTKSPSALAPSGIRGKAPSSVNMSTTLFVYQPHLTTRPNPVPRLLTRRVPMLFRVV